MSKIKKLFIRLGKNKRLIIILVVLAALGFFIFGGGSSKETLVNASVGNIEEEVLVTGNTRASSVVNLAFEISGKVSSAPSQVGAQVGEGTILAVLDQSALLAERAQANANLSQEMAKLNSVEQTSSATYVDARASLVAAVRDAYRSADDAVRNKDDQFFRNPQDYNPTFDLSFKDGSTVYYFGVPSDTTITLSAQRSDMEKLLKNWQTLISRTTTDSELTLATNQSLKNLETTRAFLDAVALAINNIKAYDFTYESTVTGYKTTASAARSEVATALTNLISAQGKLSNIPVANATGGQAYTDVISQQARVDSLRANVSAIEANLAKTVIRSPISGVVTKADAKVGQIVTPGSELISVIGNTLQIESNVSEVNIGRVKLADPVSITLDAFPGKELMGKVSYIDPGETVVDGVATYKVTVTFTEAVPEEVRSGLTANLRITTARKDDVIKVPAYAVEKSGDKSTVTIRNTSGKDESREVITGLRGKDGTVEVVSGLNGNETLVVSGTK